MPSSDWTFRKTRNAGPMKQLTFWSSLFANLRASRHLILEALIWVSRRGHQYSSLASLLKMLKLRPSLVNRISRKEAWSKLTSTIWRKRKSYSRWWSWKKGTTKSVETSRWPTLKLQKLILPSMISRKSSTLLTQCLLRKVLKPWRLTALTTIKCCMTGQSHISLPKQSTCGSCVCKTLHSLDREQNKRW